jgi:hypothetical protein
MSTSTKDEARTSKGFAILENSFSMSRAEVIYDGIISSAAIKVLERILT